MAREFDTPILLPGAPTAPLHAATKDYADRQAAWQWYPSDHGLLTWTFDPLFTDSAAGVQPGGNGWLFQMAVKLPVSALVSGVAHGVRTAGATLTSGQNLVGLFDSNNTRVGVSSDQTTAWASTGFKQAALTAAVTLPAGVYYVLFLANGTTRPTWTSGRADDAAANYGRTAINWRTACNTTAAATAMPTARPTPNANSTPIWCGLY